MECSKRLVAMGICVVLLFAFAAEVNAQCSLSALAPCYGAVQGAYPPRPNGGRNGACCRAVMTANPACLCSQMQQGRYPQNMIRNAFAMPRVCGRTNLKGYKCGSKCNYSCRSWIHFRIWVSWLATHWLAVNIPWFCFVHVNKWSKISTSHRCFFLLQCTECAALRTFFSTISSLVLFYSSVHSACDFHVDLEAKYRSHHSLAFSYPIQRLLVNLNSGWIPLTYAFECRVCRVHHWMNCCDSCMCRPLSIEECWSGIIHVWRASDVDQDGS